MAFSLVAQNPMAAEVSYRKLEGPAKGGNACVILGETDVNFRDAVRIPGFKPFDLQTGRRYGDIQSGKNVC